MAQYIINMRPLSSDNKTHGLTESTNYDTFTNSR